MKAAVFLLAILGMVAFLPVVSPEAEAASIPKTTFPPKFGIDVGPAQWVFATTGFTWTSGSSSMTLTVPTLTIAVAGSNCAVAQAGTFSHNSTGYIWASSWASACNGRAMSGTQLVYVKNTTQYNVKEVIIKGTWARAGSPASVVGMVGFPLSSTSPASVCDSTAHTDAKGRLIPACTIQQFGQTAFDFAAIAGSSSYNNVTKTVTASSLSSTAAAGSYLFDPLALDGSAKNGCNASSTCAASLTTSTANDVIIAACGIDGNGRTISSVSDTAGLTWTQRVSKARVDANEFEYYAISAGTLSGDSITCHGSASGNIGVNVFGISGADTSTVFDPNNSLPKGQTEAGTGGCGVSCAPQVGGISTSNANDFAILIATDTGSTTQTAGSGFTLIQSNTNFQDQHSEYQILAATQSSVTWLFGTSISNGWAAIADAVQQASGATTTVTTSVTTAFTTTLVGSTSVASTTTTTECFHGSQTVTSTSTFPSTTTITYTTTYTTGTVTSTTTTTVGATASVTIVVSTSFGVSSIVSVSTQNSVSVDTALIVSCGGSGTVKADPPSYLWLLLIPVAFLIALIARRRT